MPPAGARRPERAALDAFAAGIETAVDRAAAASPNPGRAPLHRMNRAEYANAVRDLLALDVDASTLLPADDSSRGFDNIADVLGVSPSLLERYVAAAAKISRLAVGERDAAPNQVTYTVRGDLSQNQTLDGQPLGTRGGTIVTAQLPGRRRVPDQAVAPEAQFRPGVRRRRRRRRARGHAERPAREAVQARRSADVLHARRRRARIPTKPAPTDPLEERVRMTPDIRLEFTLKVKAGPQTIGVAFLDKSHAANEDLVRRPVSSTYDVFIGMQYGYTTAPHLSRVVITGPYNPTGISDTPSRQRLFVCVPPESRRARRRRRERRRMRATDPLDARAPRVSPRGDRRGRGLAAGLLPAGEGAHRATSRPGIEMALRRVLADPEFIFRFEPTPAGVAARTPYRVSDTELASRLSFFLWSSIPDDELLKLADRRHAAPAGRAREADAPHAGRPQGAGAGRRTSPTSGSTCAI